jgi:hypothetical protein
MESNYSRSNEDTQIYPYCYKIKENCPPSRPCPKKKTRCASKCLKILAKLMSEKAFYNKEFKEQNEEELLKCLMRYGDIYKQLKIELYVNPKTKLIMFPDMKRIQANFNLYLKSINTENPTTEEKDRMDEKFMLYDILMHEKLKEKYDEFYYSYGFSDLDSLQPKEYGIARILGPEKESSGGKKNKGKTNKKKSKSKISKKKYVTNKTKRSKKYLNK